MKILNSSLKNLIEQGELEKFKEKANHRYSIKPKVVHGKGLASLRGFPTANMLVRKFITPPLGVYAVTVKVKNKYYKAAANLTIRTRVYTGQKNKYLEIHIFNFNEMIYGKIVKVTFYKFIRPKLQFSENRKELAKQLKKQLPKDIKNIKDYFKGLNENRIRKSFNSRSKYSTTN
ncbi:MAG: riboflavin kinase [Candidatus Thorarchaeota archaeon]